ncbi:hypothetical protein [Cohnella caldifontis]|uniref:hypothetical protein n=1 Tax=Cohnella caldifontis TaxID=3027471 RepID=UPI0023EC4577|nr:hypothetical protein [Cohnella sp. YIM B05605]
MRGWSAAWRMAQIGWKREWPGMLFTFLFAVYCGWIGGFTLGEILRYEDTIRSTYMITDWFYLLVLPVLGQLMNCTVFAISRGDIHTKKIAHWRTMPIPLETIAGTRLLNAVLLTAVNGLVFLGLQYAVSPAIREQLPLAGWLCAGLVWIGYALAVNAVLIWFELGCSGKVYVRFYWAFVGCCLLLSGVLTLSGVHLVRAVIREMQAGHYIWLVISPVAAAAALYAGYRLTLRRMRGRSFAL